MKFFYYRKVFSHSEIGRQNCGTLLDQKLKDELKTWRDFMLVLQLESAKKKPLKTPRV